jgi:hypothetical protein
MSKRKVTKNKKVNDSRGGVNERINNNGDDHQPFVLGKYKMNSF